MGDADGDLYFCDEHDNLYDFGLFGAGNLLAWTHPNGTKYVQGRLLKDAETGLDKVKHQHYKDMIAHLESQSDLSDMDKVKLQHYKDMVKLLGKNAETSGQWEIGEQLEEAQMNAEGKKRKKLSGQLSDPFDELSLDSGDWKGIVIGFGVGLLGLFGYSKLRK